ncbi:MAG: hypothetical protein HKP10_05870 [Kiritimatiellales bacterium]|nr:hypothetical protein [Kiritimatiellales bacterium]
MKVDRFIISMSAVAFLLLLCGCEEDDHRLKFSHFIHVEDNGMECADCHGGAVDGHFLPITHETCSDCHEEAESETIATETCGYCHAESKPADLMRRPVESEVKAPGVFVHSAALAESCRDCHGTLMAEKFSVVPDMNQYERLRIREAAHGTGMDCAVCHADLSRDEEPDSHGALWIRQHAMPGGQDEAVCSICHTEDSCRACHSVMQPASHNNRWRLDTHGAFADWNREGCMVCHEEDSCSSCHSQVKPRSHTVLWIETHGLGESGRCMVCHEPEGCNACHSEQAPSSHNGSWEATHGLGDLDSCYVCHTPDTCTSCHAGETPGSHSSGSWLETHGLGALDNCSFCHVPDFCAACHQTTPPASHGGTWESTHGFGGLSNCYVCHEPESCSACHQTTRPSSHTGSWDELHCTPCHMNPDSNCILCHENANDIVAPHEAEWPSSHSNRGYNNQTDCMRCH